MKALPAHTSPVLLFLHYFLQLRHPTPKCETSCKTLLSDTSSLTSPLTDRIKELDPPKLCRHKFRECMIGRLSRLVRKVIRHRMRSQRRRGLRGGNCRRWSYSGKTSAEAAGEACDNFNDNGGGWDKDRLAWPPGNFS
jgi:hypothetical protein